MRHRSSRQSTGTLPSCDHKYPARSIQSSSVLRCVRTERHPMILQKGKCDQSSRCPASWRSKCTGHAHGRHLREMDVEEGECGV